MLLEAGADVDKSEINNWSLVHLAVKDNE